MASKKARVVAIESSSLLKKVLTDEEAINLGIDLLAVESSKEGAISRIKIARPDVVVIDFDMTSIDCADTVRAIKDQFRVPIVATGTAAKDAFNALTAGATEFVRRIILTSHSEKIFANEFVTKILFAAMANQNAAIDVGNIQRTDATPARTVSTSSAVPAQNVQTRTYVKNHNTETAAQTSAFAPSASAFARMQSATRTDFRKIDKKKIIVIGASTGGTEALHKLLTALPADIPGILIVQHMPAGFTKLFAQRLNRDCLFDVKEAESGDVVRQGRAIVAAGDYHLKLALEGGEYKIRSVKGEKVSGHCPSVDVMFSSVAEVADNSKVIGVILTGMGRDGANGMLQMRKKGAFTIGQDEKSCVVYGMPKEAFLLGGVCKQLPLDLIAGEVVFQAFK